MAGFEFNLKNIYYEINKHVQCEIDASDDVDTCLHIIFSLNIFQQFLRVLYLFL